MPPGVTFQVDMSCSDFTIGYVAVTGPFSNWCGNCNKLSDNDGDGVYQGTFLFDAGTVLEYKYQVDNWTHEENLVDDMVSGATCAPSTDYDSYANRQVTVVDGPPVVVSDTFDSCSTCP
jgi:1,4-alpha-glucan branching enzyme